MVQISYAVSMFIRTSIENTSDSCLRKNEKMRSGCFEMERTKESYSIWRLKEVVEMICWVD